jgi:hypothetical protein
MKSLKDYLTESKKTWNFRIKVASKLPESFEKKLKSMLEKHEVADMKVSKTPIQKLPLDFNNIMNCEVHIYEVTLNYPTTPPEIAKSIHETFGFAENEFVVRYLTEPTEEYQKENTDAYVVKMESELENPYGEVAQTLVGQQRVFKLFQELNKSVDVESSSKADKQTPLFTKQPDPKGVR